MNTPRPVLALLITLLAAPQALADAFVDASRAAAEAALQSARTFQPESDTALQAAADTAAAYASARQLEAIAWTQAASRLIRAAHSEATALGPIADHPDFCLELGLLLHEKDDAHAAIALAKRLCTERPDQVDAFPALAAAITVVHDGPFKRRINENHVRAPDPIAIFDYFTANGSRLRMNPARTPALLLVHVVDVTESIEQLEWALARYNTNPDPGDRFFEIVYDSDHFRQGKPKKVTEAGDYRLESIKQHGGVCADQAYFAESVGKACGVPTAYVVARGATVSHAWIGFLDDRRKQWNFDEGRYESYQNLRGTITSPQTGETIADADAGLLAGLLTARPEHVHATMGAAHAAARLAEDTWTQPEAPAESTAKGTLRSPRTHAIDDRLALVKLAMARCAAVPPAWQTIAGFADNGELQTDDMNEWARAVDRMCGSRYPDFSYDFMTAMIGSIQDLDDRQRLLEWAFSRYRARPDLASAVRFEQGKLFAMRKDNTNAWAAYEDIVKRFLNEGPMSAEALAAMSELLEQGNADPNAIIPHLEDAARRVDQPSTMGGGFATQSNHYKIHAMLAHALDHAGRANEARQIRQRNGIRP